jgi:hypothetical protein
LYNYTNFESVIKIAIRLIEILSPHETRELFKQLLAGASKQINKGCFNGGKMFLRGKWLSGSGYSTPFQNPKFTTGPYPEPG